ncbi:MAG: thiamine pyrophosphate-binding protein [Proteobacteria bacterium]|nr:thiamine pyrophosphate-binding protein [Pseudomonadota bacterium]
MPTGAARVIAATLDAHGVEVAYCVPGESYLPLTDAFLEFPNMKLVVCRHESGAGLMAVAHGKLTGKAGVCIISRGPGAMNAAISLHVAYHDAEPVVFLVGQAELEELGRMALQEMNYSKTFSDTAKLVIEALDSSRLSEYIARAFHVAQSGTPGPVVVVLPEDILYGDSDSEIVPPVRKSTSGPSMADTQTALEMIEKSERPLAIAGGGLHGAEALAALTAFAETFDVPVASPQRRFHVFDSKHSHSAGRLASRAPAQLLDLMKTTDLLMVIGDRMGPSMSQSFTFPRAPIPEQPFIHVWPDAEEVGRLWHPTLGIACDAHEFLKSMLANATAKSAGNRSGWVKQLNAAHNQIMNWTPVSSNDGVVYGHVIQEIDKHLTEDAVVTVDAGNFSSWPSRFLHLTQKNDFLGATVGAMGPGVPCAVAAGLSTPGRQVVAFVGDGGVMMTGNELATAVQYGVPIKIFVANNSAFGTIRMHQAKNFPGRVTATELRNPDFVAWGEAFGAKGYLIQNESEIAETVAAAMAHDGPVVVETRISLNHIAPGTTIEEIEARATS